MPLGKGRSGATVTQNRAAMQNLLHSNGLHFHSFSLLSRILRFSTSSASSSTTTNNFSNYLVNSLGFTKHQSLSTSTKLIKFSKGRVPRKVTTFEFQNKADSVVSLLQQNGLDQSHIRNVVTYDPRILFVNVDKTLKPRIDILQELGFSRSELARLASSDPDVLLRPLSRAVNSLRKLLGSDENVTKFIKRCKRGFVADIAKNLIPNVDLLEKYGVPSDQIQKAVIRSPPSFLQRAESFRDVLTTVEGKWGIPRTSRVFCYAVTFLTCFSEETIDSKCRVLKSFGWTDLDVLSLVRSAPSCLSASEANIKNRLEFLMYELGYEPSRLVSQSCMLTYSLEKRLLPRHRVLEILKDKGLLRKDYMLHSAVALSESRFLERFVQPFKEAVPDLHEFLA